MVLGKLTMQGSPTNADNSRTRAYCACSRCGKPLFGHFFSHLSILFSFSRCLGHFFSHLSILFSFSLSLGKGPT